MTILVYDDLFLEHRTGVHPECPERLTGIVQHLRETGLWNELQRHQPRPARWEDLLAVHSTAHVETVREHCRQGAALDQDTPTSPRSWDAALLAAGALLSAADAVLAGESARAFCLARPPGHHATPTRSMGFCLFSNVAICARYIRKRHGLKRLAIVDFDVHHGNGTQAAFFEDADALFLSLHRAPFYPGTGSREETGRGAGAGTTVNIPLAGDTPRSEYRRRFRDALERHVARFKPEIVLVSAGFDGHRDDPVGGLGLEVEDFGEMTAEIVELANRSCEGRVISALEGGYNLDVLPLCVEAHLRALG